MIFFRRLPGLCYNHVYTVTIALSFSFILIIILVNWGFLCSNLEPWRHVNKLCETYEDGKILGDMCSDICTSNLMHSYTCRSFHAGKDTVFGAIWSNDTHEYNLIVKSIASQSSKVELDWTNNPYPTEREFQQVIQQTVNSRLNISLSHNEVIPLSQYPTGKVSMEATNIRRMEIEEIWSLLQDNEYLLSRVYQDLDVFPKIIGTCGNLYVTQYLEPVLDTKLSQFFGQDGSIISWESRLNYASMILDLVDNLDELGLLICDVKPGHFGLTAKQDRIKLLDLDVTFPKVTADKIASDGRPCDSDEDCSIFDCVSKCSDNICTQPIISTNIQVICRKIFLGVSASSTEGFVHLGGLLLGNLTPAYLASMLRQCSQGNIKTSQLSLAINTVLRSLHPKDNIYSY